jgi:hypothetical protein
MWRFILIVVLVALATHGDSFADDPMILDVLSHAQEFAQRIRSFEFRMTEESSLGRCSESEFVALGSQFRGKRVDSSADRYASGKTGRPVSELFAFNNLQEQIVTLNPIGERTSGPPTMFLADGGMQENRGYKITVPLLHMYSWLRERGEPNRWDVLIADKNWERAARSATYIGQRYLLGQLTHGLSFPQHGSVPNHCVYEVWFAPNLGYAPIKYERKLLSTGEESTVATVETWKVVNLDGEPFAFPTKLVHSENGKDGRSLAKKFTLLIDVDSLKVNEPVDQSVFTIVPEASWVVYDTSKLNRTSDHAAELDRTPATFSPPESKWRSGTWIVLALAFAACSAAAAWKLRQSA